MQAFGDVQVVYAAPRSADEEIVRRIREARDPRGVTVVTDDRALASAVSAAGARTAGDRDLPAGRVGPDAGPGARRDRQALRRRQSEGLGTLVLRPEEPDRVMARPRAAAAARPRRHDRRRRAVGARRPGALAAGVRALEGFGYRVSPAPNVLRREPLLGLAGAAEERAAGYRALLLDPEVKAILFARGGYGVAPALRAPRSGGGGRAPEDPLRLLGSHASLRRGF